MIKMRKARGLLLVIAVIMLMSQAVFAGTSNSYYAGNDVYYKGNCEYAFAYSFQNGYVASCTASGNVSRSYFWQPSVKIAKIEASAVVYGSSGSYIAASQTNSSYNTTSCSSVAAVYDCFSQDSTYYRGGAWIIFYDYTYGTWSCNLIDTDSSY